MMEKPDDLTLPECQKAFAMFRLHKAKTNFDLIMTLANRGLWHICEQIFGYLNYETVENCRKVSELWSESLDRIALVKYYQEFGDRYVEYTNQQVSTIIAGWKIAVKKFGSQTSIEDLREVKDSLQNLVGENGECCYGPVHQAARNGAVKLMEFIIKTSFDMNVEDDDGNTAWHEACKYGRTETAQLIIQYSKDFGIDLNAKNNNGKTAWHEACSHGQTETAQLIIQSSKDFGINMNDKDCMGRTAVHCACANGRIETVQLMLKNWKEFGIDIKAQTNQGESALDVIINYRKGEIFNLIREMLEKELTSE